jgi:hypothetical protein
LKASPPPTASKDLTAKGAKTAKASKGGLQLGPSVEGSEAVSFIVNVIIDNSPDPVLEHRDVEVDD